MRIHSVEAIAVDIPLTKNFGGSTYAVLKRSTVITRMRTDGGLVSEVYNGDNREHGLEIVRLIQEELAPRLRGERIFEGERLWEGLFAGSRQSRDKKTFMEAIACVVTLPALRDDDIAASEWERLLPGDRYEVGGGRRTHPPGPRRIPRPPRAQFVQCRTSRTMLQRGVAPRRGRPTIQ